MFHRKGSPAIEVDTDRLADYRLIADVGNPFDADGLTRADLSGSGELVVEEHRAQGVAGAGPEQGPAPRLPKGGPDGEVVARVVGRYDFGIESAKEMIVRAASFPWSQRFPTRPGIPSEPILQWVLRDERGPELSLTVWLRDAEKDEAMGTVVTLFRHAVDRATQGEAFL